MGGIVGWNRSIGYPPFAWGSVSGSSSFVSILPPLTKYGYLYEGGGLIGRNDGIVTDCFSAGNVEGTESLGGLIGLNKGPTVSSSFSFGDVTGGEYIGGFIGENYGSVSKCFATGVVTSSDYTVGGFVGGNYSEDVISECYASGNVIGDTVAGGFVGSSNGPILNCFASGDVSGDWSIWWFCW